MKTQGSSPHSQVPAVCPYPEPDVSLQQVQFVTLRTGYMFRRGTYFILVTSGFCVLNSLLFTSLFVLFPYFYFENRFSFQTLKTECNLLSFSSKNIIKYKQTQTNSLFSVTLWRLIWIYIRKIHFVPHREYRVLLLAPPVGECFWGYNLWLL